MFRITFKLTQIASSLIICFIFASSLALSYYSFSNLKINIYAQNASIFDSEDRNDRREEINYLREYADSYDRINVVLQYAIELGKNPLSNPTNEEIEEYQSKLKILAEEYYNFKKVAPSQDYQKHYELYLSGLEKYSQGAKLVNEAIDEQSIAKRNRALPILLEGGELLVASFEEYERVGAAKAKVGGENTTSSNEFEIDFTSLPANSILPQSTNQNDAPEAVYSLIGFLVIISAIFIVGLIAAIINALK